MQVSTSLKRQLGLAICLLVVGLVCPVVGVMAQQPIGYQGPDATWRLAHELLERKAYGPAAQQLELFLAHAHNDALEPEARYLVAHCHLKTDVPTAIAELQSFETRYPESQYVAQSRADRALYYYAQNDFGRVTEVMQGANYANLPDQTRAEVIFKTGYANLTRKQFGKADTLFTMIKDRETAFTAPANYYSGYLSVKANKLEAAIKSLERAEKDSIYSKMTPLLRTVIYYRNKRWDQAIAAGEKFLVDTAKVSGADEITRLVAESYYNKSKYAEAAKYYDKFLNLSPANNTRSLRYRVGYAHFMAKDYDKAVDNFGKVINMTSDSLLAKDSTAQFAYYYSGVSYIKLDNKAFAVANFDKARESTANKMVQETSWFNYGKLLYEQEKFDDAITTLKAFDAKYPDSKIGTDAQELISEALLNSNNYDDALKYIYSIKKRSQRVDRAFQRVNYLKGLALYNQNRYADAVGYLESSLKINEDTSIYAASALLAAESLTQTRKYQEAIGRYKLAQRWGGILPYYRTRSRYGMAYAHYNLKEYEKAATGFRELVMVIDTAENKDLVAEATLRLADCHYVRKQYKDALGNYTKAMTNGGYDPDYAAYQKGVVESLMNNTDAAIASYDYLAATYPGSPYRDLALFQKANILFDKSQYQEATNAFGMVIGQGASANVMPLALLRRAQAQNNLKNYESATADFKRIIDEYPTSKQADDAILGLQEAAGHTGATEDLQAYLVKFKESNPESKSSQGIEFETAKNLFFSQKYDAAINAFKAFATAYPAGSLTSESYYYLGECYFRKNDRANSILNHQLVVSDPGNTMVNKSLARLADLALSSGDANSARGYYAQLSKKAKNKKEAVVGTMGLMEAYFALAKYDSTSILANQILNTQGTPQDALNKANLNIAKVALVSNELDKALDELLVVVNNAKDVSGAEAMYLVAEVQAKQGKHSESIETLFDLNKIYSGYPKWYDKSFLLIADNYMMLGKTQLARYTLQNLIDKSPNPTIRGEAKTKMELIK